MTILAFSKLANMNLHGIHHQKKASEFALTNTIQSPTYSKEWWTSKACITWCHSMKKVLTYHYNSNFENGLSRKGIDNGNHNQRPIQKIGPVAASVRLIGKDDGPGWASAGSLLLNGVVLCLSVTKYNLENQYIFYQTQEENEVFFLARVPTPRDNHGNSR